MRYIAVGFILVSVTCISAQTMDGRPYRKGVDADVDMYIGDWRHSLPRHSHGSLVERDILTKGDPMAPTSPGAVLAYVNRFVHASLGPRAATTPTTLDRQQEVLFILSGTGRIDWHGTSADL